MLDTAQGLSHLIRARSFDHNDRVYDVFASVRPASPRTVTVHVTCNGHEVYFDYPDGVRTQQCHEVTFLGEVDSLHLETMNVVDFTMDDAEKLVRAWVA
jgi:hypothetical protein